MGSSAAVYREEAAASADEGAVRDEGRICIALHDLRGGGAERACLRLARGIVGTGRDVDLVLVRGEGEYLSEIPAGVRLHILDCPRVFSAVRPLARYFRDIRPASVLSALTHMNLTVLMAARLARSRTRIVISERNQIGAKARTVSGFRQRAVYRAVPFLYPAADAVVAVSEGVARDVEAFGRMKKGKVSVINNPVFDSHVVDRAGEDVSHPWFAPDAPPVLLAVGRLHRQKGFDLLLQALAIARRETDCRLVILGEGAERAALETLARDLGIADAVDFHGFAANPYAFMARASAFVLSSRWEGFPNALVEAMACGVPVIAADCPSGPREILDNGLYGELTPPEDPRALARAIAKVLATHPATETARARAQSYSIAAATERYLDILEARR